MINLKKFSDLNVSIFPDTDFKDKTVVDPADLDIFVPHGTGIYGYQDNQIKNPFGFAPPHEPCAGLVYFDSEDYDSLQPKLCNLFSLLEIKKQKNYYVIIENSSNPQEDGYLQQMRIITDFAMKCMFKFEKEKEPIQPFTIPEALCCFAYSEIEKWGSSFFTNKGLWGKFGGDGYMAKEQLSFGFMIENNYFGVYRIWSRAWLVTK